MGEKSERDWAKQPPQTNGEKLRSVREAQKRKTGRKVTQRDAARILGLDEHVYRSIEYDRRELREEEAQRLATAWREHPASFYLVAEDVEDVVRRPREVTEPRLASPIPLINVPFVGPTKAGDWITPLDAHEEEPIPADMYAQNVFVSYVVGDSMQEFLREGDKILLKSSERERPLPRDIVMVRNGENDLTVKQLLFDGVLPYLHPLNPKYEDMYDEAGDWKVIGILIGYIRDEDGDIIKRHNPSRLRPR